MNADLSLLDDYILRHTTAEHPYLHRLYRATQTTLLRPRMASGPLQGQLLRMIAQMVRPKEVLEIGTFTGYSALSLASGMAAGTHLLTYEVNDEQEAFTRPWLDHSPFEATIEFVIGDAMQLLPQRKEVFDLAFVDANKRDYCAYYDLVLPRLRSGGLLVADNTLWDGHVIDPAYHDAQTQGIRAFNVEQLILPLRDGLTIIRKK